jgi:hypothetical protein
MATQAFGASPAYFRKLLGSSEATLRLIAEGHDDTPFAELPTPGAPEPEPADGATVAPEDAEQLRALVERAGVDRVFDALCGLAA